MTEKNGTKKKNEKNGNKGKTLELVLDEQWKSRTTRETENRKTETLTEQVLRQNVFFSGKPLADYDS